MDKGCLSVRGLTLGKGRPKICVPVVERTAAAIREAARRVRASEAQLLEWRADCWDEGEPEQVVGLLREIRREIGGLPLLFTYRTRTEGGVSMREENPERYLRLNQAALASGVADIIDVELGMGESMLRTLCGQAHAAGAYVLASSHDFAGTPPEQEMEARFRRMEEWGADILKLSVMPKSAEDLLSLLRVCLTAHRQASRPVVAISMGEIGLESRVCGEAFGSAMTFGCLDQASAPGQLAAGELACLLDALHAAHGKTSPFQAENERK